MIRWLFLFLGDFENGLEGWLVFSSVLLFVLLHFLFCAEDTGYCKSTAYRLNLREDWVAHVGTSESVL